MKAVGVIPARLASTRLPEKLLRVVAGKTIIEWTWRNARRCRALDDIVIACDDRRIFDVASGFGARVCMTASTHQSGTDRIAEAAEEIDAGVIVNVQADEPLVDPSVIEALVRALTASPDDVMATAIVPVTDAGIVNNPNVVKVVVDGHGYALYFSRAGIPFLRDADRSVTYYRHMGIYAYRKPFLKTFTALPKSVLEQIEKLEQLRVLEAGYRIRTVVTEHESIGVDTAEDLAAVAAIIERQTQ